MTEKDKENPRPTVSVPKESGEMDREFLKVLAHQIKSPINTIESMLNTLAEGMAGDLTPRAKYFIEKAIAKTDEARQLVSDLMFFEMVSDKPDEGKVELDILSIVGNLVSSYHAQASEKNVSLVVDLPDGIRVIQVGNQTGLEHAFRNLIDNAIKYTPSEGEVVIVAHPDRERKIISFSISDTGAGIPVDELENVFEPFYRSRLHKGKIAGTGLGLPITRRVILNHEGDIIVESEVGEGTTFTVTLPFTRVEDAPEEVKTGRDVVIIGGVTAGPKVAARLRRLDPDASITIIEKSEFLSYSGCGLPYYVSGQVSSPRELMTTSDNTLRDVHYFHAIKDVKVRNRTVATSIDRDAKEVTVQDLKSYHTEKIPYDVLVLATGALPVIPDIPGMDEEGIYTYYNIQDAEALKKKLSSARAHDVFIIGGGLIGVETSESLVEAGARVTILEKAPTILSNLLDRSTCKKIQKDLNAKGIKTIVGCTVERIRKRGDKLIIVTDEETHTADFIILSTGVRPNSELAGEAGLKLTLTGGVRVNSRMQTSDPSIYAVGDCVCTFNKITGTFSYWPLGSIATKMGRVAADNIAGRKVPYPGSIGTCMFRVFENTIARSGLTYRAAAESGFDPIAAVVTGLDRSSYIPGSNYIILKVIADRKSRVILGAQGYGKGDVDKRIEILAAAIYQGLTLKEVFDLDLGFFPAFNSPIDVAQNACLLLENRLDGLVKTMSLEEFEAETKELHLVDVSPVSDFILRTIPDSINIPLENLRIEGLPFEKSERTLLFSRTSSRAYEAYRYLSSIGYENLLILEGGYLFWE